MRFVHGVVLLTLACGAAASRQTFTLASQQPPTAPQPGRTPAASAPVNPNQDINDRFVKQLSETIAGQENEPAEAVFMNIQIESLKNVPAGRFLRIMNGGYSRALGVACTHCHVEQDFASDDKRPKRAAREMAVMHRFVNCSTCHRGEINPIATTR